MYMYTVHIMSVPNGRALTPAVEMMRLCQWVESLAWLAVEARVNCLWNTWWNIEEGRGRGGKRDVEESRDGEEERGEGGGGR